jgi:endonuclease-3
MRRKKPDPKALMDRLAQAYPDAKCALDHRDPFELVVATILSAQCTDARVNLTTPALFARFPNAASLASARQDEVETLIKSTGFFRNKAKNIIAMAQALLDRHHGQLPENLEALAALPGVGQKTANVVLANAFDVPALAVDTHIFRVARRLGLSSANTPEKVEADLCKAFPREVWIPLHHQLIFHGRRVCEARKPDCDACPLLDLCPTGLGQIKDPHTGLRLKNETGRAPVMAQPQPLPSEAGPKRIVSLVPSMTELLVQWGLAQRIVGRTRYCISPKWIRATVPSVGGTKDADLAKIRDLAPDLVLLEKDENPKETADGLTTLGIPWKAFDIKTLKDCAAAWRELGALLGVPTQADARADALERSLKGRKKKGPLTLTLIWKGPWMAAGEDTYLGDLVRQSGLTPIGGKGYPALEEEDLEALAPDVILLPTEPFRFNARHQSELQKRFPDAQVLLMDGQAMTWYLSRTEEGLEQLQSIDLH